MLHRSASVAAAAASRQAGSRACAAAVARCTATAASAAAGRSSLVALRLPVRALSVSPAASDKASSSSSSRPLLPAWLNLATLRAYAPQAAAIGGVTIVVYGLSRISLYVAGSLLSLTLDDAFFIGLATGGLSTVMLGGAAAYLYRKTVVNPDAVARSALTAVQKSSAAQAALGTAIRPGLLKASVVEAGHVSAKRLAWVEPRARVMFDVRGELADAVVSAEGIKVAGKGIVLTSLALDAAPPRSATPGSIPPRLFLLRGDEAKLHAQGHLRGFLQLERATFVPQDKAPDDDAQLLSEQEAAMRAAEAEVGTTSGRA